MMQTREPKKVCGRIGFALFAMMGIWLVANLGGQLALVNFAPAWLNSQWALWIINDGTLYLIAVPVFLLIMHSIPDGPVDLSPRASFGIGKFVLCVMFCFGATWLLNIATILLMAILQLIIPSGALPSTGAETLVLGEGSWLPALLFGVLVPATGEEFLFRYMMRRKLSGASDKFYIFFSALCFALFHGNLAQTAYTFMAGVLLAWLYVATGRLWVSMILHLLVNLVGLVVTPALVDNLTALMVLGLVMILLIIIAIVFFFVFKRWAFSILRPPSESGWPYKPPPPRLQWVPHYGYATWAPMAYVPPPYTAYNGSYTMGNAPVAAFPAGPANVYGQNAGTYAAPGQTYPNGFSGGVTAYPVQPHPAQPYATYAAYAPSAVADVHGQPPYSAPAPAYSAPYQPAPTPPAHNGVFGEATYPQTPYGYDIAYGGGYGFPPPYAFGPYGVQPTYTTHPTHNTAWPPSSYAMVTGTVPSMAYGYAQTPYLPTMYPPQYGPSATSVAIGNAGMICFLCLSIAWTLLSLILTLLA